MCLGIPTRIIEICPEARAGEGSIRAIVELSRVRREVNIALLLEDMPEEQLVGQWAIVHAGFAISLVDEEEAAAMLQMINEPEY
ncbi:MAG: HypC/HybG/HupF family hydrogenase formation chaperone [Ketobacteraceae bacterium]|nr:HypC/HybG/HupF family hydrogenase formation chaperone [Ketobacteraceae bacterium]